MGSKYSTLLEDQDVRGWHDNLSAYSLITTEVYLGTTGLYCDLRGTTPKRILKEAQRNSETNSRTSENGRRGQGRLVHQAVQEDYSLMVILQRHRGKTQNRYQRQVGNAHDSGRKSTKQRGIIKNTEDGFTKGESLNSTYGVQWTETRVSRQLRRNRRNKVSGFHRNEDYERGTN